MIKAAPLFLYAVFLWLLSSTASALRPCKASEPWDCFSSTEVEFSGNEESGRARVTYFENGEVLAEVSKPDGSAARKMLVFKPYSRFYFGMSEKEITEEFPFHFFEYAFATPLMALRDQFPKGPVSIVEPIIEVTVQVVGIQSSKGKLSAKRVSPTRISDSTRTRTIRREPRA